MSKRRNAGSTGCRCIRRPIRSLRRRQARSVFAAGCDAVDLLADMAAALHRGFVVYRGPQAEV